MWRRRLRTVWGRRMVAWLQRVLAHMIGRLSGPLATADAASAAATPPEMAAAEAAQPRTTRPLAGQLASVATFNVPKGRKPMANKHKPAAPRCRQSQRAVPVAAPVAFKKVAARRQVFLGHDQCKLRKPRRIPRPFPKSSPNLSPVLASLQDRSTCRHFAISGFRYRQRAIAHRHRRALQPDNAACNIGCAYRHHQPV